MKLIGLERLIRKALGQYDAGAGLGVASLDAAGKVPVGQVPDLDAAKIATGVLGAGQIPNLDAAKITSGVFAQARVPIQGYILNPSLYHGENIVVSAEELTVSGLAFNADGTRMYIVGYTNDTVYQYTLVTAWDVSTAIYLGTSFSVATQEAAPQAVRFSVDGTKMYITGSNSDTVFQYSLSAAWDISTASYGGKSISVAAQETAPQGLAFSADGTKMYIVGLTNATVYQYNLGTPWDVTTAVYNSFKSVAAEETNPYGITFSQDGRYFFIVGLAKKTVFQYQMGNAWNVGSALYTGFSRLTGNASTSPYEVEFSADGTKMFVVDGGNGRVSALITNAFIRV